MKNTTFITLSIFVLFACDDRINKVPPEQAATKFVGDLGIKTQGQPNCTGVDTDNDGYVTCTVMVLGDDKQPQHTLSLQCAGLTSADGCDSQTSKYATGCKETVPKIIQQQQQ
jgi:hypothetical protein